MAPLAASQLPPEQLRAGEQIAYYSMAFVCGDPQGYREAVVLGVNTSAGATTALTLDTGDIITPTMMLKRIVGCSGRRIAEVKALWRKLRTFQLVAGAHDAPTRASTFNRAIEGAVRQAFAAAYQTGGVAREEISRGLSGVSTIMVEAPATDSPASSAPRSHALFPRRRGSRTQSSERGASCEDSQRIDANVETDKVPADAGDPRGAQRASATAAGETLLQLRGAVPQISGEGHVPEDLTGSDDQESQNAGVVDDAGLVDLNDYLRSIPTRLKRAKIRHQAKKRPGSWHVPRSRKRRDQKKCAVTRSGSNIYHAHTVKARSTKETLQRAGIMERLRALHILRPTFAAARTDPRDLMKDVIWPQSVRPITESEVPEGLEFPDIGDGDPCQCYGDCFMDSCKNAQLSIYCTPECCGLGGVCSNSPRSHPGLKLYDTCRVGLGVHTTASIEVGDVVGEYVGRLFEYPAVLEGQPAQAIKQNSGYTMLLNTLSVSGMFVYIEALKCGSITRFMSHSCDPNVEFVEMQNGANVKVLARMIKSVRPGTQLTVSYGDEMWFKCACDTCWLDPDDEEE
ncbi:Histone-lysine N-methyltransferase [Phytophthora citrophthora]|uniref:Histone-lysine N-methyltransferase n=1 Tax=Phytophthora citrophthora TaxID=4793 RepID=A0AAD9GP58_9STRA|nr:Histone-lysine N-methyltransferase [Phytophthora citrophthora]